MNILYIHQYFTTTSGATGTRSYEFAKALINAGHQVTVICGSTNIGKTGLDVAYKYGVRKGTVDGINVIEINLDYSNHLNFFARIGKFLHFALRSCYYVCLLNYDLVYATSTPLTVGLPGIIAKKVRKKRFVFEVRDLWPEIPVALGIIKKKLAIKLLHAFERYCYQLADQCIALSPGMQHGIEKQGISPNKIVMIPNGCDIDLFQKVSLDLINKYTPFFQEGFWFIYAGAHGIANGLEAILAAAKILKQKKMTHIKILFVGDGRMKPHLIALAKQENLDNCIFWAPLPKEELAAVLKNVQVGLMLFKNVPAFYYGTSPNKFFDYLAAGLPIAINYPGWMAEFVKTYSLGRVVVPDDPQALADVLISLSQLSKEQLHELGSHSLKLAQEMFDRRTLQKRLVNLQVFL